METYFLSVYVIQAIPVWVTRKCVNTCQYFKIFCNFSRMLIMGYYSPVRRTFLWPDLSQLNQFTTYTPHNNYELPEAQACKYLTSRNMKCFNHSMYVPHCFFQVIKLHWHRVIMYPASCLLMHITFCQFPFQFIAGRPSFTGFLWSVRTR